MRDIQQMPYQPIPLGTHVTGDARKVVRKVIDPYLSEFHYLLTVQHPEQGPKGSLQRVLAALVLAATDGAAQLLHPGKMRDGDRFIGFMKANFPWELDPPDGLTIREACDFVWDEARCSLLHRFGMRSEPLLEMKFGRSLTLSDEDLTTCETHVEQRPYTKNSVRRNDKRTILWIEAFYLSLRLAIPRAIDTKEKVDAVSEWVKSGKWDRTRKSSS